MIKRIFAILIIFNLTACAELQQVVDSLPQTEGVLSNTDIASGLRQALDLGIDKQVTKLTQTDGFFKNDLVKILLPEELQKVDDALRKIGLSSLADEGLKVLNRAAEDAVSEATPIFIDAVKTITFNDAKTILLGNKAALENLKRFVITGSPFCEPALQLILRVMDIQRSLLCQKRQKVNREARKGIKDGPYNKSSIRTKQ